MWETGVGRDAARQLLPQPLALNPHSRAGHHPCPTPATMNPYVTHANTAPGAFESVQTGMWETGEGMLPGSPYHIQAPPVNPHSRACQPVDCIAGRARAQRPCSPIACMYIRCLKRLGPFGQAHTCGKLASQPCRATPCQIPPLAFHTHSAPRQAVLHPPPSPATVQSQCMHAYTLSEMIWSVQVGRYRQGTSPSTAITLHFFKLHFLPNPGTINFSNCQDLLAIIVQLNLCHYGTILT